MLLEKVLILSDTHIYAQGENKYGIDSGKRLSSILKYVEEFHQDAKLGIVLGDLTESGSIEEYSLLKEILDSSSLDFRLLLGNHDVRENYQQVFNDALRDSNHFAQGVHKLQTGKLVFLDTLKSNFGEGEYCSLRQKWLENVIDDSNELLWIFMHHPPYALNLNIDRYRLGETDSQSLLSILGRKKDLVQLIIHGHVHRNIAGNINGLSIASVKSSAHQRNRVINFDSTTLDQGSPHFGILNIFPSHSSMIMMDLTTDPDGNARTDWN